MTSSEDPSTAVSSTRVSPLIWGLAASCLLMPFLLSPGTFNYADFPKRVAVQFLALILLVFLLSPRKDNQQTSFIIDRSSMLIAAFGGWSFLSLFWAINVHDGLQLAIHWTACAAIFFIVQNIIRTPKDFKPVATTLTIAGTVVALIGISQYLFDITWIPQKMMPGATFSNKNLAAQFIVLVWPLAVYRLANTSSSRQSLISALATALMLLFVLFSTSKAAWVAMTVESVLIAVLIARETRITDSIFKWSQKKSMAVTVALALVLAAAFTGNVINNARIAAKHAQIQSTQSIRPTPVTSQDSADPQTSSSIRLILWSNTLAAIGDYPVAGIGIGNFYNLYPLYYDKGREDTQFGDNFSPRNAHNDYLQVGAELGLIGITILALFALSVVVTIRALLVSASPHIRLWTIMISAAITGGAINAFFSFPMQLALPPFLMMLFSGTLCGLRAHEENHPRKAATMIRIPLLVLILAIGAILGRYHYVGLKARIHFFDTIQYTSAKRWPEVVQHGEKALALLPGLGIIHSYIGMAQFNMGLTQQAAASFDKALAFYPTALIILKNSGVALASAGYPEKAAARFSRYIEIKPDNPHSHELLADAYRRQGKIEAALGELLIGADLDPDNGNRYIEVGRIAEENKHHELATKAFSKATTLRPGWGTAHYYYGLSLYRLDRSREGKGHLTKALTLGVEPSAANIIKQVLATQ